MRYNDLLVEKSRNFYTPPVFSDHAGRQNFVKMFDADKTRMTGLPYGGKIRTSRSHLIQERDGRTELLYQYRASVGLC